MSNSFEPWASDFLGEDLYFIFDDENVVYDTYNKGGGIYISSELEWPSLDSDDPPEQEEIPSPQPKKKKKIKKTHRNIPREYGFSDITASAIKALSGLMEDLEDDEEFVPHIQNFKTAEIKEVPLISSKHKDYRRFRYYDLIRSKLDVEDALGTDENRDEEEKDEQKNVEKNVEKNLEKDVTGEEKETNGKVRFNMQIGVLEFDSNDAIQQNPTVAHLPLAPSLIISGERRSGTVPKKLFFSFIEDTYASELRDLLQETYDRFAWELPKDYSSLHSVMGQAKRQAGAATENVLRAFESISTIGKHLMGVINRLQASSMRYLVLKDADIFIEEPSLRQCLADCEDLQQDVLSFKQVIKQSEEHMATKKCHISEGTHGSMYCSKKIKELFAMVYEKDQASWRYLQTIISLNDTYTRCINFLTEMTPERVFRFLKNDFGKMLQDITNVDYLCVLLLEQIRKSLADIQAKKN